MSKCTCAFPCGGTTESCPTAPGYKKWHEMAMTPKKDTKMPMTEEHFYKVIAMHEELIFEQKDEISKLKSKVGELREKLASKNRRLE